MRHPRPWFHLYVSYVAWTLRAPTTARKLYDAQGDVLINWLSKCRGGTMPPTLGRSRAVMGALHASVPTTRAC